MVGLPKMTAQEQLNKKIAVTLLNCRAGLSRIQMINESVTLHTEIQFVITFVVAEASIQPKIGRTGTGPWTRSKCSLKTNRNSRTLMRQ